MLFIEDDKVFVELLKLRFENLYDTHFIDNLTGGIVLAQTTKVDIVFCDLSLPDAFGIQEILNRLLTETSNTPLVLLSGIRPLSKHYDKRVLGLFCKDNMEEVETFLKEFKHD